MGLDTVEYVLAIEAAFDVSIPDSESAIFITPRDIGDFVERELGVKHRHLERSEIDEIIKQITMDELGVSPQEYRIDSRFIEDFGIE